MEGRVTTTEPSEWEKALLERIAEQEANLTTAFQRIAPQDEIILDMNETLVKHGKT